MPAVSFQPILNRRGRPIERAYCAAAAAAARSRHFAQTQPWLGPPCRSEIVVRLWNSPRLVRKERTLTSVNRPAGPTLLLVILANELNDPGPQRHARVVQVLPGKGTRQRHVCPARPQEDGRRTVSSSLSAKSSPRARNVCMRANKRSIAAACAKTSPSISSADWAGPAG